MVAAASDSEPLQEAANRPAQNRYRNWGLSTAEIKAYRGIYPEVGGGDGQEVGGDPAAAESAGIPEALAGACASEAVPHAPVARARRRRSRDSLLPELRQLALQHRIVNVGAMVEVQRRRVGDLVLHPLVQERPGAARSRQPRHPERIVAVQRTIVYSILI
jgi:hypothetical protein